MKDPLKRLSDHGQSIWLAGLTRHLLDSDQCRRLMATEDLRGLTFNPSVLQQAITETGQYRDLMDSPGCRTLGAETLYHRLAVRSVREASDALWPVYESTHRRDGYVSWGISPSLAHDLDGTVEEARRLWELVDRENLMIEIPATREGIAALRLLVGEGININVTLLFDPDIWQRVCLAYMDGLDERIRRGGDPARVASVASFSVNRIDAVVDDWIAARHPDLSSHSEGRARLRPLQGKAACALARMTYQRHLAILRGERWQALGQRGARTQRLLWANTGPVNPACLDVFYVEELVGPDTVTNLSLATLDAFLDHGQVRASLTENPGGAADLVRQFHDAGVPLVDLTAPLLASGIQESSAALEALLRVIRRNAVPRIQDPIDHLRVRLFRELGVGS